MASETSLATSTSTTSSTRVSTSTSSTEPASDSNTTTPSNRENDFPSPSSDSSNVSQSDTSPSRIPPSPEGLTAAAKAGIAVGAVVGALLLVAVLFMACKLKKYKQGRAGTYDGANGNHTPHSNWSTAVTEVHGNNGTGYVYGTAPKELPSAWERPVNAQEMYDDTNRRYNQRPAEMDGQGYR
ncbi:hypothetical protein QBC41DRAFT_327879 [Cercophora samala]|uniref:Uncharacterized protein n=1 Tax=Cercophora samala TaxID=330535 RepID=A0AA40D743_9PEZI|nr:hypothetical protein QBC41DRAFT_327879 [Cercophora samala]